MWVLLIVIGLGGTTTIPFQSENACIKAAHELVTPIGAAGILACINQRSGKVDLMKMPKVKLPELPGMPK